MINLVKKISIFSLLMMGTAAYAQDAAAATAAVAEKASDSTGSNPLFLSMAVLTGVLLFVIVILSAVLRTSVKTKVRDIINARSVQAVVVAFFLFSAVSGCFHRLNVCDGLYQFIDVHSCSVRKLFCMCAGLSCQDGP